MPNIKGNIDKKRIDLTNAQFGKLTVLKYDGYKNGRGYWICQCECGTVKSIVGKSLRKGLTKSCGCEKSQKISEIKYIHGDSKSRLYKIWKGIKARCYCKSNSKYYCYGERGISVCQDWIDDYSLFKKWALSNGYSDNLTIDRIDNSKGYSPDNCRWVTNKIQANNKRTNILIDYLDRTQTLSQWCEELQLNSKTIRERIQRGWPPSLAFTTPIPTPKRYRKSI